MAENKWICPACGQENDGKFCVGCGAAAPVAQAAEAVAEAVEEKKEEVATAVETAVEAPVAAAAAVVDLGMRVHDRRGELFCFCF